MTFIFRDTNRTIHDDFRINVSPRMGKNDESNPVNSVIVNGKPIIAQENEIVGWLIKPLYE